MGEALIAPLRHSWKKASAWAPFFVVCLFAVSARANDEFLTTAIERASQGDVKAQVLVGHAYEAGQDGAPRDYASAMTWYRKAADRHDGDAELAIAHLYQEGKGVAKDAPEANAWLQVAADDGNARAMDFLGDSYLAGRGVAKDEQKAIALYKQAARRDVVQSEVKLAGFYFSGEGVPQDYGAAYYWMRIAQHSPGKELFPNLDTAAASASDKLTPAQRAAIDDQVAAIMLRNKQKPIVDCGDSICLQSRK